MADRDKGTPTATGIGHKEPDVHSPLQQATAASTTSTGAGTGVSAGSIARGPGRQSDSGQHDTSHGASSHTGEQAQHYKEEAKHKASDLAQRAKEQGKSMLEQQKGSAAQQVDSVAQAFRKSADHLQGEGQSQAGQYVGMVAERLEDLGRQLREKDMDTLLRDAENLSRRSPAMFFAGSIAAGFLLARFMKSSSQRASGTTEMSRSGGRSDEAFGANARTSGATRDTTMATGPGVTRRDAVSTQPGVFASGGGADTAGRTANSLSPGTASGTTATTTTATTTGTGTTTGTTGGTHGNR